jgi:hypothetical protein
MDRCPIRCLHSRLLDVAPPASSLRQAMPLQEAFEFIIATTVVLSTGLSPQEQARLEAAMQIIIDLLQISASTAHRGTISTLEQQINSSDPTE